MSTDNTEDTMNTSTDLLNDLKALQQEFGLTFALTDPDEPVTTTQRTINDLFFALLDARHELTVLRQEPTLQQRVGKWATQTFPASTPESIVAHMRDEVEEIRDQVHFGWSGDVADEAADVYLLLLHLAHRYGFTLDDAAERKFEVVQERTYTTDSGRGYIRHDEGEGGPDGR